MVRSVAYVTAGTLVPFEVVDLAMICRHCVVGRELSLPLYVKPIVFRPFQR